MLLAAAFVIVVGANPYLDEGRARFGALEFEAAARALAVAMNEPRLSVAERREGHDLWAQSLLALGRGDEAVGVYARLLKEDPHAPPPRAAPKVIEAFTRGKQSAWPAPSVSLEAEAAEGPAVSVRVTDPWSLVKRVRRMEDTGGAALAERPAPPVVDHRLSVVPSADAQRLLLDALDAGGVLLAHLEVPVSPRPAPAVEQPAARVAEPAASPRPRWVPVLLAGLAVIAAGVGAMFLGYGYRGAPRLDPASEINAWNGAAQRNAAAGWSLGGAAVLFGVAAAVLAAR